MFSIEIVKGLVEQGLILKATVVKLLHNLSGETGCRQNNIYT
jgi:hypothetical protein